MPLSLHVIGHQKSWRADWGERTEEKKLTPPKIKGYDQAYELSYKLAREKLAATGDIERQCRKADAIYEKTDDSTRILVQFLGRRHAILLPEIDVISADKSQPVLLRDKLLILHYLNTARGTPPTQRLVTFRELPAGPVYFPTFTKRTIKPIVDNFGKDPSKLAAAAAQFGARRGDMGDVSVIIDAFPRVPITFVVWGGDEELPPQGNVLYDANISDYLPTEDITVLTESIAWRLVRS